MSLAVFKALHPSVPMVHSGPYYPQCAAGKLGLRVVNELLMRLTAALGLIAGKHWSQDSAQFCLNSKPVFLHCTMLPLEIREVSESTLGFFFFLSFSG